MQGLFHASLWKVRLAGKTELDNADGGRPGLDYLVYQCW